MEKDGTEHDETEEEVKRKRKRASDGWSGQVCLPRY